MQRFEVFIYLVTLILDIQHEPDVIPLTEPSSDPMPVRRTERKKPAVMPKPGQNSKIPVLYIILYFNYLCEYVHSFIDMCTCPRMSRPKKRKLVITQQIFSIHKWFY